MSDLGVILRAIERLRYERSRINKDSQAAKAMTAVIDILLEGVVA